MIKMWISNTHGTATVECAAHSAEQLVEAKYKPGYFLTDSELEQFAKDCFEAARENTRIRGYTEPEFKDFATFWAERKEKAKDEKN